MKETVYRILSSTWARQILILLIMAAAGSFVLSRLPYFLAALWENLN
ncbi:hypothetical protein V6B16_12645 [Salinimicrobium catena]